MSVTDTPDRPGYFGRFGGRYVPEALHGALNELEEAWESALADESFIAERAELAARWGGRPTPVYFAERLSEKLGRKVWLKREDLAHTGAHKLNNVLGQAMLAKRMGKPRIIAETGAGQHGVASATAAARFGLECVVYMGAEDCRRQRLNVVRMQLLGAEVRPVNAGTRTLKDAVNEAMRDWVSNVADTHYLLGSAMGPHPFPTIVRELQAVISEETKIQMPEAMGGHPDVVLACVGGGSNAIGAFARYVDDGPSTTRLIGVEAAGEGMHTGRSAATISEGKEAVLHGMRTIAMVDDDGQVMPVHSVSAGLDYPGVGPEHAHLHTTGRAEYVGATDEQALRGFRALCELEGIIPALEPSHVIGWLLDNAADEFDESDTLLVNLAGRGDKDVDEVVRVAGWDVGVPTEDYMIAAPHGGDDATTASHIGTQGRDA
jgi:tryptophan synthase beta chain